MTFGGYQQSEDDGIVIEVSTEGDFPAVAESAFMHKHATTKSFAMRLQQVNGGLIYRMTTMLDIYGREFEHTDMNRLQRK